MTASFIHPDAIAAALPDLDAEVACEAIVCDHPEHQCHAPAQWRMTLHGYRSQSDYEALSCSTMALPMCTNHLEILRESIADELAGHTHVLHCGAVGKRFARFPTSSCRW